MNLPLLKDRRTAGLLNRVREDIFHLRQDIGNLLSHTTKTTLPQNAHLLAEKAKRRLEAGSSYAVSHLRDLGNSPGARSAGWIGGALVLGLLAYGAYSMCQKHCPCDAPEEHEPEDDADTAEPQANHNEQ